MVRLFGIVEVVDDAGAALRIGGLKERTVLARLAIEAGSWVSESRLIDALWPEEPPPSARRTLQKYVSRLRTTLPATVALESRSGSYRLVVDRAACDLTRVEDALRHARHEMRSGRASEAIARCQRSSARCAVRRWVSWPTQAGRRQRRSASKPFV